MAKGYGSSGKVCDTSDGKDLSKNAKNVIGGTKATTKPLGPNANKAARS